MKPCLPDRYRRLPLPRGQRGIPSESEDPIYMDGLLDELAVPRVGRFLRRRGTGVKTRGGGGFWKRNSAHLDEMLGEIFVCYQRMLRQVHPWGGGSRESYAAVIAAWVRIQRLFAMRGVTLMLFVSSLVPVLFASSSPCAVLWTISRVIILPFQCQSIWFESHVGEEVGKLLPTVAHLNASPSVIVISDGVGIVAPLEHVVPADPFSGVRFSVLKMVGPPEASAGARVCSEEVSVAYGRFISAVASAYASAFKQARLCC